MVPCIDQYIEVTRQSSYHTIYRHLYKNYTYTTVYIYKTNMVIYSNTYDWSDQLERNVKVNHLQYMIMVN